MTENTLVAINRQPGDRLRVAGWDLAAVSLIPLSAFLNFTGSRGYSLWSAELALSCLIIVAIALIVTCLVALRPDSLRPLVLAGLILMFLSMEIDFALPAWLEQLLVSLVGEKPARLLYGLFYFLPITFAVWVMREKASIVAAAAFGVMALLGIVMPSKAGDPMTVVERSLPPLTRESDKPPPVIHIIIDQQIGIDGLPAGVEGTPALRGELLEFFDRFDFHLYTGAFSHFPATMESVPNMLNGATVPLSHEYIAYKAGQPTLTTNLWFDELKDKGFKIEVIQSDYIDYCGNERFNISYCYTFIASDLRVIESFRVPIWQKSQLLLYRFFDKDFILLSQASRVAWFLVQKGAGKLGFALPDWTARSFQTSPLPSLIALEVLAERLESLEAGEAIFAHLLLPNDPFILDEACRLKSDLSQWYATNDVLWWFQVRADPQQRLARYEAYYKQVECVFERLTRIFEAIEERPGLDQATVYIHGDHGSRISLIEPNEGNRHLLSRQDIVDSMSTIFAHRGPNIASGRTDTQVSVQALFAQHALGHSDVDFHNDVFLRTRRSGPESGQLRLPMSPFEQSQ